MRFWKRKKDEGTEAPATATTPNPSQDALPAPPPPKSETLWEATQRKRAEEEADWQPPSRLKVALMAVPYLVAAAGVAGVLFWGLRSMDISTTASPSTPAPSVQVSPPAAVTVPTRTEADTIAGGLLEMAAGGASREVIMPYIQDLANEYAAVGCAIGIGAGSADNQSAAEADASIREDELRQTVPAGKVVAVVGKAYLPLSGGITWAIVVFACGPTP